MPGIEDLKTDAQIASILQKLKDVEIKPTIIPEETNIIEDEKEQKDLQVDASSIKVKNSSEIITKQNKDEDETNAILEENGFVSETILPWFNFKDKDTDNLHYMKFKDGIMNHTSVKMPSANDLAALKMRSDFICEVDYYKFDGEVLFIKQLNSNYGSSRVNTHESLNIVVEDIRIISDSDEQSSVTDTTDDMIRDNTDDLSTEILSSNKYYHFIIFTDKGIADFITLDDVNYPYDCSNLTNWLNDTSNFFHIINPRFDRNNLLISEDAMKIRDFNYDLITMHRPGIITLDSMDNSDSDYQLHVKLKDDYSFIPYTCVLKYLKDYSRRSKRSIDDFRRFVDRYFDIIV